MTDDLKTKSIAELHQILAEMIVSTGLAAIDPKAPPEKWKRHAVRYFQYIRDCKASISLDTEPRP